MAGAERRRGWRLASAILASTAFLPISLHAEDGAALRDGKLVLGPLDVTAGLVVAEEFNDNIFANRLNRVRDLITIVSPAIDVTYRHERGRISAGAVGEFGFYADNPDENYEDYRVYADSLFRLGSSAIFTGGVSHERDHEERTSPDDVFGQEPTVYQRTSAYGAARFSVEDDLTLNLGATASRYDFEDVPGAIGVINNDDRDRTMSTAGGKIAKGLTSQTSVFANLEGDFRSYDTAVDDNGYARDSNGARVSLGLAHRFSDVLEGEAYAGWIYQDYEDAAFNSISELDYGGRLRWRPLQGTELLATAGRSLQETTLAGAPGYLQTAFAISLYQWLRPDVRFDAGASYYDNRYPQIGRSDHITSYSAGIRKYLTPFVYVGPTVAFTSRDSSTISESYEQTSIMLRLGRTRDPAYDGETATTPFSPEGAFAGIYAGVQAGLLDLATKQSGPRGNGGSLNADFGDDGAPLGGLYVGGGVDVGAWYFGLEGEANVADAEWHHQRLPGGRVFSAERSGSYSVSGLVGRRMPGGNMVYARAGIVSSEFETAYQTPNNLFRESGWQWAPTVGVGAQMALTARLALRMEYNYAAFDDFLIGPSRQPDAFRHDESGARLGLSYRFDGSPVEAPPAIEGLDFSGVYAGVQAGLGTVASSVVGDREAGSVLSADFGDTGLTGGAFGGYGMRFGSFYVGGELTAELSDADWDHEREPTGRSFSLKKSSTIGGGLLLGHVVNDRALVYGRADIVRSTFDLDFTTTQNAVADTVSVNGLRLGVGMELPVTASTSLRFDYSHTSYEDLSLRVSPVPEPNGTRPTRASSASAP